MDCFVAALLAMTVVHGPNYPQPALIPPSTVKITPDV
jgi:hypothetical protein